MLAYMLLTTYRDFRENFSSDVWRTLGYGDSPAIFTKTETPVSLAVLFIMGSIMLIRNNKRALMVNHIIIMAGMVLIGVSTFLFENKTINAPMWMVLIGDIHDEAYGSNITERGDKPVKENTVKRNISHV